MRRILAVALIVVPLSQVQAQRPTVSAKATWITVGLGRATWDGLTELGGQLSASHQTGRLILSGRALVGFDLLGAVLMPTGTVIDVQDFGLMVGVGSRPGLIRYSLGTGIGIASVQRKGTSGNDPKTTAVGLPLEGQLFIQPVRFLGVGIYGYGDVNKEKSFWGWSISVALGRVR